jgi:Domain of unknown function (DUF6438)
VIRSLILASVLVYGCTPKRVAAPAEVSDRSSAAAGEAISLERTACFGRCPVYLIAVTSAGAVTYEGRTNVRHIGSATAQVSQDSVAGLLREMEQAGYFTFSDRYAVSEPTCRRYTTDSPSAISSATFRGRTKRIEHDYGCGGVPGALTVLEQRIDEVLGSGRWTGR